jgi:ubiquinone/menaquinone biosynthesis C-methylase UbiE
MKPPPDHRLRWLMAARAMEHRPDAAAPAGGLEALGLRYRDLFGVEVVPDEAALEDLAAEGLLHRKGETGWRLTAAGRARVAGPYRRRLAEGFGAVQCRFASSTAYGEFCRRAFGLSVGQFSLLDEAQLRAVVAAAGVGPGDRAADLGCGSGGVTAELARRTGAEWVGVDLASSSLEAAGYHKAPGLTWRRGDLHELPFPEGSFDALVAIDVLAFLDEPAAVLQHWLSRLRVGGRLVVLGSPLTPTPLPWGEGPGRAGIIDFTEIERRLWRRQQQAAAELREAFEAEGNADLYRLLASEAERCLPLAEAGRLGRWLMVYGGERGTEGVRGERRNASRRDG